MKTITFVIMAALIFGVAVAPVISGTAIAQSEDPKYTEKEKKQQRSDESKERKVQQNAQAEERKQASEAKHQEHSERKEQSPSEVRQGLTAAQELQQQRIDALKEKQRISQELRDEQERIDRAGMQQRIDQLDDRSPMTEALDRLRDSQCGAGTIFDSESNSCVLIAHDTVRRSIELQNTTLDGTGGYFDQLRHTILEQQRLQDNLSRQITMLLNLVDSMCEDRVLVTSVSDGKLRCMDSDRAFNMQARGLVTLVE